MPSPPKLSSRILIIGDTHLGPGTGHRDYLKFLLAVANEYHIGSVLHVGDVVDWGSISYHEKEPWAVGPDREQELIEEAVQPFGEAFPEMHITNGNHCDLPKRRLKTHGLPLKMLGPDRNWLIGAPDGWKWYDTFEFKLDCGVKVLMQHSFSGSWASFHKAASTCCLIQGHHHEMGGVAWSRNINGETFALSAGCGINPDHPIFNYRKQGLKSVLAPILGCGIIIDGYASFVPMWLKSNGRWNNKVP